MQGLDTSLVRLGRLLPAVGCAASLAGCGPDLSGLFEGPVEIPVAECDEVLAGQLRVAISNRPLELGESWLVSVIGQGQNASLSACKGRVESVTWASLDPTIVRVDVNEHGFGAYVTGVSLGVATVTAEVVFLDGGRREVTPAEVRVVPASGSPAGAELVIARTLVFDAASGACPSNSSSCSHEHFTLERGGELIVIADWGSPLNTVAFNVFNGHCVDTSTCHMPTVLGSAGYSFQKPIRVSKPDVPAGPYTLRIGNSGPGPETVLYEIWLR